jgi:hypothetical protein
MPSRSPALECNPVSEEKLTVISLKGCKARVLDETCPECGFPTIEERRNFKGENLAVAACLNLKCEYFYNWEVPSKAGDVAGEIVDEDLFGESEIWAREEAEKMRNKFFKKQPFKIEVPVSERDIDRYLSEKNINIISKNYYRSILKSFVRWLGSRAGGRMK